jgi:hypothetical protein
MDVALDTPAIPVTKEQIETFLAPREPREDIPIDKTLTLEQITNHEPLPEPVFEENEFGPWAYDAGASLDKLETHAVEFAELVEEMFAAGEDVRLTKEGIEQKIAEYKTDKDSPIS